MTSWRDRTPRAVKDDLDELTDLGLQTAHQMLEESGEFYPFAVTVAADGGTSLAMVADEEAGEHPDAGELLNDLVDALAQNRDDLRCAGVVYDAEQDGSDAVRVFVEHRDGGPAIAMVMPYEKSRFRGKVTFGELDGTESERRIWPG